MGLSKRRKIAALKKMLLILFQNAIPPPNNSFTQFPSLRLPGIGSASSTPNHSTMKFLTSYYHWLHGKWPAGTVEKLPEVGENGATAVEGVRIVGDLSGIPLLKFSSDTGARAVQAILAEADYSTQREGKDDDTYDIAIIGGGVSGFSAAMEANKAGLKYVLFESSQAFSTVANFPKGKPIYTYPTDLKPSGGITYEGDVGVKEKLLEDMRRQVSETGVESTEGMIDHVQRNGGLIELHHAAKEGKTTKALRCIVAIGRSGNYRKMNIPGEDLDKVTNRLIDPAKYEGQKVCVVGGGDSAVEAAIALSEAGAEVTVSYRKPEFNRPKPENVRQITELADAGKVDLQMETNPSEITDSEIVLAKKGGDDVRVENDAVLAALGREAPLDFFRRSKLKIANDHNLKWWLTAGIGLLIGLWIYHWKKGLLDGTPLGFGSGFLANFTGSLGEGNLLRIIAESSADRSFWYSLAYCMCVLVFGIRRIKRRKTPYVTRQTVTLNLCQWIPLFILPYIVLPWMGANGWFSNGGGGQWFAETFFSDGKGEGSDQYWRAFGFVLAWPLFIFNAFTEAPLWGWLIVGFIQTFVIIPLIVQRWGKGAYCGWICSCGALAETMGDAHRHKMPHGTFWNKVNMVGQVFLALAFLLLALRIIGWVLPESVFGAWFKYLLYGAPLGEGMPVLNYAYFVDLLWAGVIGVSFYFHLSGRVWCRFACPLAALMHIYQKAFGKFRIFAEKEKCISCNVCTSVCHQGIDIMNFANKGKPMEDPECVRCSACVQQCPTGVLSFGRLTGKNGGDFLLDKLAASPVKMKEEQK